MDIGNRTEHTGASIGKGLVIDIDGFLPGFVCGMWDLEFHSGFLLSF